MGMVDVLRSIKNAEQAAEKRLSDAQDEVAKLLSDARKKSSEMIQTAADTSVAASQAILDDARNKAQAEADLVKADGAKAVASIESKSADNQAKAVQMVIDSLSS